VNRFRLALPVLVMATLVAGCAVGPDYHEPPTPLPSAWDSLPAVVATGTVMADEAWWASFADPLLDDLIVASVRANFDLQKAEAAVREARALRQQAVAGLVPTLDATTSYQRSKNSENLTTVDGFDGAGSAVSANDRFIGQFDAGWEIDLFGRVQRGMEATSAGLAATVATADGLRLSLIGEVARAYTEIRGLQRRIAITREEIETERDTLSLTQAKYQAGTGTGLDVVRAQAQLANTEAQLPPLETALRQNMFRLSVLSGRDPAALVSLLTPPAAIPTSPEAVKAGMPADLIRRRPDIRNAERQLAQATAAVGVAVADLYPRLTLAGTVGVGARSLGNLAQSGSALWSVGPQLDVPVVTPARWAEVDVQRARAEQAEAQYRATVLAALEEVENALTAFQQEENRRVALLRAVANARDAVALTQELYQRGLSPFLDVLVAQRTLYLSEIDHAISETSVTTALIAIYKALGGGWDVPCCRAPADQRGRWLDIALP
jgi:multidrug efflux system outer membrane protein